MSGHQDYHERFVRWQQVTIAERGSVLGLLIAANIAVIGFSISTILTDNFHFRTIYAARFIGGATIIAMVSLLLFLITSLNRLKDLRQTTAIARKRSKGEDVPKKEEDDNEETGRLTHQLIRWSIGFFSLAAITLITGLLIQVWDKIQF